MAALPGSGVDSTTCTGLAVNKYGKEDVIALTVAYGQKHTKIQAARKTAEYYEVEHLYLDLEGADLPRLSDCSLLKHSDEIPHESYAEQLEGEPMDHQCQPMCRFGTDYFFPQQQALRCQKTAV